MSELYRVLGTPPGEERRLEAQTVPLDVWLDDLEAERDALIMRLRAVERPLVRYGRIKGETLGKRIR